MRGREIGNATVGVLSGAGVAVVAWAGVQLLLGFGWGIVCRVLDCDMAGFLNPWVLAPLGVVSLVVGVYLGWITGRKTYRRVAELSAS